MIKCYFLLEEKYIKYRCVNLYNKCLEFIWGGSEFIYFKVYFCFKLIINIRSRRLNLFIRLYSIKMLSDDLRLEIIER